MSYLLDTNAVIALLKNEPAIFRKRLRRAVSREAAIAVSSIVLYELWYGVARSARRRENAERLRAFLSGGIEVPPSARRMPRRPVTCARPWRRPARRSGPTTC